MQPGAAGRALERLVAFNVLERPARGRYRFHDLVREYVTERLTADKPEDERRRALDRELDWYVHAKSSTCTGTSWPPPMTRPP